MQKRFSGRYGKTQKLNFCTQIIASVLCLVMCLNTLAIPAYALDDDSVVISAEPLEPGSFDVQVTTGDGSIVSDVISLSLAQEDMHHFTLTAEGTAATGYCTLIITDENGGNDHIWYINPLYPGTSIQIAVTAADKTNIQFVPSWGTPPDDGNVVISIEDYNLGAQTSPIVYLEVSRTPCIDYMVPERSSLDAIASHYGVSAEDILLYNGVDAVVPGMTISIPYVNPDTAPEPYTPFLRHTVAEGETLQMIAEKYYVTTDALCHLNAITADAILSVGTKLAIPNWYTAEDSVKADEPSTEEESPAESNTVAEEEQAATEETISDDQHTLDSHLPSYLVNNVPLYFQNDYPDILFGSGTVETSGCCITCLAMVATAMTGHEYLPDELADYFGGRAINNIARLEYGSDKLQLPYWKSENWNETWAALRQGKIVIALMEGTSLFTDSQHFIVLTGLNEAGKIMVHDSYVYNYDNWQLKNGFENGFEPNDILLGYSGAWIYDPAAMPEEPFIYSEPRLDRSVSNYPEIKLTTEERNLLARMIWVEARGECPDGQQAIAEVVFNRMMSDRFPNTISGVIYAEGQFNSVPFLKDAEPYQAQYQAIDRALYGEPVLSGEVVFFARYPMTENIWKQIDHHIFCW